MTWQEIEDNWPKMRIGVRERWGRLTPQDLDTIGGKRERLSTQVQTCYQIPPEEAEAQVNAWVDEAHVKRG